MAPPLVPETQYRTRLWLPDEPQAGATEACDTGHLRMGEDKGTEVEEREREQARFIMIPGGQDSHMH